MNEYNVQGERVYVSVHCAVLEALRHRKQSLSVKPLKKAVSGERERESEATGRGNGEMTELPTAIFPVFATE